MGQDAGSVLADQWGAALRGVGTAAADAVVAGLTAAVEAGVAAAGRRRAAVDSGVGNAAVDRHAGGAGSVATAEARPAVDVSRAARRGRRRRHGAGGAATVVTATTGAAISVGRAG